MKNALDCYYDYKLDKFIPLEDIEYKNNRDINLLIEELRQYTKVKNEQDINGEYEPPFEGHKHLQQLDDLIEIMDKYRNCFIKKRLTYNEHFDLVEKVGE